MCHGNMGVCVDETRAYKSVTVVYGLICLGFIRTNVSYCSIVNKNIGTQDVPAAVLSDNERAFQKSCLHLGLLLLILLTVALFRNLLSYLSGELLRMAIRVPRTARAATNRSRLAGCAIFMKRKVTRASRAPRKSEYAICEVASDLLGFSDSSIK